MIRTSVALACIAAHVSGEIQCTTARAEIPVSRISSSHHTTATLKPVAKFGTPRHPSTTPASSQREGWNLRWRRSDHVRPPEQMQVNGDVFADADPSLRRASHQPTQASHQPTSAPVAFRQASAESDQRGYVSQAAHAAVFAPQDGEFLQMPDGNAKDSAPAPEIDFFEDPFGLPDAQKTIPSPDDPSKARMDVPPSNNLTPRTMPPEDPSINELRNDLRNGNPSQDSSLRENAEGELQVPPSVKPQPVPELVPELAPLPVPEPTPIPDPVPAPKSQNADDGMSLPDLMRQEDPERPTTPRDSLELLPPPADGPEPDASPSDRDLFDNPFNRDDASSDRRDRDRLRMEQERNEKYGSNDMRDELQRLDAEEQDDSTIGISCEEFRQRIAGQTIRDVSLDISPPFRPDVIDESEYQRLKSKFDEKQSFREWRSIDGRSLGSGRLVDLAYEKVVIESEYGSREEVSINRLGEADLAFISENWGLPNECLIEQVAYTPRTWTGATMTWKASNLCHKPLYFEEVNLERYGHTAGPVLQPIVSSAHFFANIAVLPYKKGIHPPNECQYALGYYRPGNCAPWIVPPVPLSVRGAARQAAAMTALFWLIP